MKKRVDISKETLRGISEELIGIKLDEGEWEEMLTRIGELLRGIKALDEMELGEVEPAFYYNPGGERNAGD
jgi:Asp-tRNA(Asn)/Glu-tRNA(Gln) amidotransferase C subunit